jgi:hypothetical protein
MKVHEIPQDNIRTLGGERKLLYAIDENGHYTGAPTTGWEVEEIVLLDVLDDYDLKATDAKRRVLENQSSPIEYFMYMRRMDLITLAQAMGLFRWQVKRHLKPEVFRKLDAVRLQQYADLFRIPLAALTRFEEET